ncbi:hypothetical protein [Saccharibacillus alkalitolerans]|uniref:hypothetical protein n=1 Tax=Saccharibacillus alkalitolerans TaxID=2705290 RepID=UPI001F3C8793|nr:hypothetical protein [Saccharibacillus alkalitolerans]
MTERASCSKYTGTPRTRTDGPAAQARRTGWATCPSSMPASRSASLIRPTNRRATTGRYGAVLAAIDRLPDTEPPARFALALKVETPGVSEPIRFDVPVEQNTSNTVIENPQMPRELKARGIKVDRIVLTPIATQISYRWTTNVPYTKLAFDKQKGYPAANRITDGLGSGVSSLGGQSEGLPGGKGLRVRESFMPINKRAGALKLRIGFFDKAGGDKLDWIQMNVPIPKEK